LEFAHTGEIPPAPFAQTLARSHALAKNVIVTNLRARLSAAVLGAPDPRALAKFYEQLLEWTITVNEGPRPGHPAEDGWVMLKPPHAGTGLSFQYEGDYERPVWPTTSEAQQMMIHLDIAVDDLDAAATRAMELGASPADHQPQDRVRVMLDPAGHPFCLFEGPF
jgi:predicted enzyme related to lactoylglutathione lyase